MVNKIRELDGYGEFLKGLKEKIAQAQVKAALVVSHELVELYWHIGREILQQQQAKGWGAQVINRLSRDIKIAFRGQDGFSPRNLKYIRKFG